MMKINKINEINGTTKVVGVFGWPISHTLSPAMHNAAFAALQLNWVYIPFPLVPEQTGEAVRSLQTLNIVGANCTIPHKQAIMRYLDHIDPAAQAIGAVNTVTLRNDRLVGSNTDWLGFSIEGYVFVAFGFWIFCFGMSRYSQRLERRLHTGH